MSDETFRLRSLPLAARLGLTCLLLVMAGGFAASLSHLVEHWENRDERPGLTMDDLRAGYHGIRTEAPLRRALEAGHPAELAKDGAAPLPDADRQALLDWLAGDQLSRTYDSIDLGDRAPAEILAVRCTTCHARGGSAADMPLEFWDDVQKVAITRDIAPTAPEIVVTSLHTHALSLSTLAIALAVLLLATRWPRTVVAVLIGLVGAGLLADLAGQWLAGTAAAFVWLVAGGGAVFAASSCSAIVGVLVDLWLPRR